MTEGHRTALWKAIGAYARALLERTPTEEPARDEYFANLAQAIERVELAVCDIELAAQDDQRELDKRGWTIGGSRDYPTKY